MSKSKLIKTPVWDAAFTHLKNPNTKFVPEGVYSIDLRAPEDEMTAWIKAEIEPILMNFKAADPKLSKASIILPAPREVFHKNEDTGEYDIPTNLVALQFKVAASGVDKAGEAWTRGPIALFDSKGKQITSKDVFVGFDDKVRVTFSPNPYYSPLTKSISFSFNRLRGVQIVTKNATSSTMAGMFDSVEGGYTVDDAGDADSGKPAPFLDDDIPY